MRLELAPTLGVAIRAHFPAHVLTGSGIPADTVRTPPHESGRPRTAAIPPLRITTGVVREEG